MSELKHLAQIAIQQKETVLERGKGGYSPSLHDLFRVQLPELGAKYEKRAARDAIILLLYLHAYVNGTEANEYYMWAFPTVEQIQEETGIHKDRIKPLCRILETEGLLITKMTKWHGNQKKMYLPLFYPISDVIPINGVA
ncbi:hypothetical protein POTG_02069 [Paenibacillus sp. oral taxon 786 str. D14]|uniref:hypothetical protein n=1 Tax=Paenibacillus sp. oral taxon 786 TaxID=652715 RepID=UPI0001AFCEC2|nr:hypothetical protein [Paenibacillus sp. oral taxon 786]EES73317.1 hypothetical protein POTG_02069 [Paenibacillus sp. oral taxon 786 str. D14]